MNPKIKAPKVSPPIGTAMKLLRRDLGNEPGTRGVVVRSYADAFYVQWNSPDLDPGDSRLIYEPPNLGYLLEVAIFEWEDLLELE